jgi:hypothetical protein
MMTRSHALTLVAAVALMPLMAQARREALPNPDFTQGGSIPAGATHTWNLGPTGARGWMHSERLETTEARQILITEVAPGSPADGNLQKGDVILGVSAKAFTHDPRVEFGSAITNAEAGEGTLALTVWRDGGPQEIRLKLPALGNYSATAPFDCAKSTAILQRGCKALAERMQTEGYAKSQNAITRSLNALALLASGDPSHLPLVRREVEWASDFSARNFQVWWNPYVMMLLAEYQLATGDAAFQGGLKRLALESANGQSIVGSWGHTFAGPDGRLIGYGMMNAPGVPLTIALHLARTAGVEDPIIDLAIDRSAKLIRFYSGKGSVPYGDHAPWTQTHEDNGKSGMAAVLFNFLEEAQPAEFFSHMSVASHGSERDTGHTGNFTNILWSTPSITLSGPHATGAWMKEFGSWYFDLARTWDFRFPNPGPPQKTPCSFGGWDATGVYLLAYAMPKRKILLTGKQPSLVPQLSAAEAASLLEDGRGWSNKDRHSAYDALDEAQLLERLASWSPTVRGRAATALTRKDGAGMPVDTLITMLDSPSLHAQYGACEALGTAGAKAAPAVSALMAQLDHEDLWLRCQAAMALAHIGDPAMVALPVLLERITRGPTKEDPRAMEQRYFVSAVFGRMLKNSLDGVDREALNKAITAGLQNQDGRARGELASIYQKLGFEEIQPLLPVIHEAIVTPAPSGIMFADGVRLAGLELLAKHRYREGMDLAFEIMDIDRWGKRNRINRCLEILGMYGGAAKPVLPKMHELQKALIAHPEARGLAEQIGELRSLIQKVEAATEIPELREM